MNTRKKAATRKTAASRKAAPKKSAKKKAAKKKSAGTGTSRKSASAKTATRKPLKLVHREGARASSASRAARPRPRLGLVEGGKKKTSRQEEREARMGDAMAEDVSSLPEAAVAQVPRARSFQQTDFATSKQMLLFRMARARTSILAALQGLQGSSAERPLAEGKWSVREMVLHLCSWDQERSRAIEPAIAGVSPEWASNAPKDDDRMNAEAIERLGHLSWDETLRMLHAARQELLAAIENIPDEPIEVWGEGHALGRLLQAVAPHDLHHADIVKRWRADEGM